ncbi:radical SAM protein [Planctomycetota bacterium]
MQDPSLPRRKQQQENRDQFNIENIAVNITRQCNLRCRFCYNLEMLKRDASNELSADEITSFLGKTKSCLSTNPTLALLGGEPLIDPDKLLCVAEYGLRHGFSALASINGTLVTDDFAKLAAQIKLQVQVSIDGHNAKINDKVRGKGVFDKIVHGIRVLVKNKVHTIMSLVCHQGNLKHLKDYYNLALSLGVNEARFIPLKLMNQATREEFKPVGIDDLLKQSYALFEKHPEYQELAGRDAFSIMANICRLSAQRQSCGSGLQTLLLDSDGSLYPCLNTNVSEFKFANIRDQGFDFTRFWRESSILQKHREQMSLDNTSCANCLVRYWCLGGCRGENYVMTGRLANKAYNCKQMKKAIIEMFWVLTQQPAWVKIMDHVC